MKVIKKFGFLFCLFTIGLGYGQSSDEAVEKNEARVYASLSIVEKRYEEQSNRFYAIKSRAIAGDTDAMCEVAFFYKSVKDYSSTLLWLNKAARNGSARAWQELGDMYKYGMGVELDYSKAYKCYIKSAELGWGTGFYSKGYMEYKGLGCTQNYEGAFQDFLAGASESSASSMYMLGLCYRNGYGVERDISKAQFWLKKAAALNYDFAKTELDQDVSEYNNLDVELVKRIDDVLKIEKIKKFPLNEFTRIRGSIIPDDFIGDFIGFLIQYDWSGKHIINVVDLDLNLESVNSGVVLGNWIESGAQPVLFRAKINNESKLSFQNMSMIRATHYFAKDNYEFKSMECDVYSFGEVFLNGSLNLYNKDKSEPERPIRIVLKKKLDEKITRNEILYGLAASPNPFESELNVKFGLSKDSTIRINVFSQNGVLVYSSKVSFLNKGEYIFPLNLDISQGVYIVDVNVNGMSLGSVKIVKTK